MTAETAELELPNDLLAVSGQSTFGDCDAYEGAPNEPLTLHKYMYAHANPISSTDPTGKWTLTQVTIVTGIAISLIGFTMMGIGRATNQPTLASIGQSIGMFGLTVALAGPVGIMLRGGAGLAIAVTGAAGKLAYDLAVKSLGGSVRAAAQQTVVAKEMSQFLSEYSYAYPRTKIPISGQIVARGIPSEDRLAQLSPQTAFGTTPVAWVEDDFIYDFVLTDPGSGELVVTVRRATSATTADDLGQFPIKIGALSGLPYERPSPSGQTTKKALLAQ